MLSSPPSNTSPIFSGTPITKPDTEYTGLLFPSDASSVIKFYEMLTLMDPVYYLNSIECNSDALLTYLQRFKDKILVRKVTSQKFKLARDSITDNPTHRLTDRTYILQFDSLLNLLTGNLVSSFEADAFINKGVNYTGIAKVYSVPTIVEVDSMHGSTKHILVDGYIVITDNLYNLILRHL